MINLEYSVAGQLISATSVPQYLVADTVGIYRVVFTFDSDWSDLGEKTAVFRNPSVIDVELRDVPVEFPLDENNSALIPGAILDPGKLFIGVYGVNGTQQMPTIWAPPMQVVPGASPGVDAPDDPAIGTAVRTAPQTLTEAEQAQARENIGAIGGVEGDEGNVVVIGSNNNIIDGGFKATASFPVGSASGSIVTLEDGADGVPIKSMTVQIEPIQAGTGDPSPSNVRAISGWTQAIVRRTGNNLYKTPLGDIGITARYISPNGEVSATSDGSACVAIFGIEGGKKYYIYAEPTATIFRFGSKYSESANAVGILGQLSAYYRGSAPYSGELQTVSGDNSIIIQMNRAVLNAGARIIISEVPINTYTVTFPTEAGTVYGGELTVNEDGTGTLTVDKEMVTISQISWSRVSLGGHYVFRSNNLYGTASQQGWCECYNVVTGVSASNVPDDCILLRSNSWDSNNRIAIRDDTYEDATAFKNAMGSYKIVREAKNPATYQLTAQQVSTLLGLNNIWADTGDISLEYYADPTIYVEAKTRVIKETIAPIEDGYTASQAYAVGSFLFVGDTLYKVTSAIASGAIITPNTNVVATTVAEQLMALA